MEQKKIKDIFNDYKTENNIKESEIKQINYIKKRTNKFVFTMFHLQ